LKMNMIKKNAFKPLASPNTGIFSWQKAFKK
jgi:hypothetical protein